MVSNHPKIKSYLNGGIVEDNYGLRHNSKEKKERGFLGEIRMPDGRSVMTEQSISVDGKEMPSIVKGMHPADVNYIRQTNTVPQSVEGVAVRSAQKRALEGKSPFWNAKQDLGKGK